MFTARVTVTKMSEVAQFCFFSADDSSKLVIDWEKYLSALERSC